MSRTRKVVPIKRFIGYGAGSVEFIATDGTRVYAFDDVVRAYDKQNNEITPTDDHKVIAGKLLAERPRTPTKPQRAMSGPGIDY
jgi:hypothetical protein